MYIQHPNPKYGLKTSETNDIFSTLRKHRDSKRIQKVFIPFESGTSTLEPLTPRNWKKHPHKNQRRTFTKLFRLETKYFPLNFQRNWNYSFKESKNSTIIVCSVLSKVKRACEILFFWSGKVAVTYQAFLQENISPLRLSPKILIPALYYQKVKQVCGIPFFLETYRPPTKKTFSPLRLSPKHPVSGRFLKVDNPSSLSQRMVMFIQHKSPFRFITMYKLVVNMGTKYMYETQRSTGGLFYINVKPLAYCRQHQNHTLP